MPIRPYDNKEYRYRHSDEDRRAGLTRVAELLNVPSVQDQKGLFYDLSFYSGGIGINDQLAVTMPADAMIWAAVLAARPVKAPEEIKADSRRAEDFLALVDAEDGVLEARAASVAFINFQRREFQSECRTSDKILFCEDSDPNYWYVVWGTDDLLHCLAFAQG